MYVLLPVCVRIMSLFVSCVLSVFSYSFISFVIDCVLYSCMLYVVRYVFRYLFVSLCLAVCISLCISVVSLVAMCLFV